MPFTKGSVCSAINCSNFKEISPNTSFFRFPRDKERSKQWLVNLRRADLMKKDIDYLYNNIRLCSLHFEDCMFMNVEKKKLVWNAVPTLFDVPNPPPQVTPKRKIQNRESSSGKQQVILKPNVTLCQKMNPKIETKEGPWCHNGTLTEIKLEPQEDPLATKSNSIVYSDMGNKIKIKEEPDDFRCEELLMLPQTASHEHVEPKNSSLLSEDHITDVKIEIKEEPWWLDTSSTDVDEIKETEKIFVLDSAANRLYSVGDNATRRQNSDIQIYKEDVTDDSVVKSNKIPNNSSSNLKQHNLNYETERPHRCEICHKSFVTLSNLNLHKKIHEIQRQYTCEICKMSFKYIRQLQRHFTAHTDEDSHKCEICGKTFQHLSTLRDHILIHESKTKFKCEICENTFYSLSKFRKHKFYHERRGKYKCEFCEKTFSGLSTFRDHKLIHEA